MVGGRKGSKRGREKRRTEVGERGRKNILCLALPSSKYKIIQSFII